MKISFIVPVYKAEQYLPQCIDSILGQTYREFELILIDDESPDRSGQICDAYAAQDARVRVLHQPNSGAAVARNRGMEVAQGEWIAFVDADDWIEPDYAATLLPYLTAEYDMCHFGYDERCADKVKKVRCASELLQLDAQALRHLEKDSIDTGLAGRFTALHPYRGQIWTKVYRRAFLQQNHIQFRAKLRRSQDVMLNLEAYGVAQAGVLIPRVLYHYRLIANSLSHAFDCNQVKYITLLMEEMRLYLERTGKMQKYEQAFQNRVAIIFLIFCLQDYCHPQNPLPYAARKQIFMQKRAEEPYRTALRAARPRAFGAAKGLLIFLGKHNMFFLLEAVCRARAVL